MFIFLSQASSDLFDEINSDFAFYFPKVTEIEIIHLFIILDDYMTRGLANALITGWATGHFQTRHRSGPHMVNKYPARG